MPYEPPPQLGYPRPSSLPDPAVRERWLLKLSLSLAFIVEVLPLEADLTVVALAYHNIVSFLVAKAVCLTIILAPLCCYVSMNGWNGIAAAWRVALMTYVIVTARLVMDGCLLVGYFSR
jgi:hypothetical protein